MTRVGAMTGTPLVYEAMTGTPLLYEAMTGAPLVYGGNNTGVIHDVEIC